jgi:hypothetical protein
MDLIYVGISLLLCALSFGFIELCERLMAGKKEKR